MIPKALPSRFSVAALLVLLGAVGSTVFGCSGDDGPGAAGSFSGGSPGSGGTALAGSSGAGAPGTGTGGEVIVGTACELDSCDGLGDNLACYEEDDVAVCRCKPGFDGESCRDVNECGQADACHESATCENFAGGFSCVCDLGFSGNGKSCADVNECMSPGLNACADGAECQNTSGGYACGCPAGQVGDGFFCKATDACDPNPCANGGTCVNTPQGFKCDCPLGFSGENCEPNEPSEGCDPIEFGDPLVEQAVRLAIGKPGTDPISTEDLGVVPSLFLPEDDGSGETVKSLAGLQCWTTLERLYVGDNEVDDLTPLANLHRLKLLDLGCNPLDDLSPLASLTSLEELYLDHGPFCEETEKLGNADLTALENLIGLRRLYLGGHGFTHLNPLAELRRLEHLDAIDNQISNVSGLAALVNLHTVDLTGNSVVDLAPLAGLPRLRNLTLDNNGLSNVAALEAATSLRRLSLRGNALNDASVLGSLSQLTHLDLSGNALTSVAGIAELTGLADLRLSGNSIASLAPLVDNPEYGKGGFLWIIQTPLPCSTQAPLLQELSARGLSIVGSCN